MIWIRYKYYALLFICWFPGGVSVSLGQSFGQHSSLYFISDCQEPLHVEEIISKTYHNREATDTLLKEIECKNEGNVFMLGDLVGKGSKNSDWKVVDSFLTELRSEGTNVYAIPGNHEFLMKATIGINNYQKRFPGFPLTGYTVRTDSMAIVMLNSNFSQLSLEDREHQQTWYLSEMNSLDTDNSIKVIIVCTHYSPFSNSKIVGSSTKVQEAFIPRFEKSPKTKLFVSGHSHNLEYFETAHGKHYLLIGGGGGIDQPLYVGDMEKYMDLISQEIKPRYFYMVLQRKSGNLSVTIHGFSKELFLVPEIKFSL